MTLYIIEYGEKKYKDIALDEWEKTHLPSSPTDGKVAFMQLWKEGQYVNAGETMFVVVPHEDSEFMGKALLPMQGAGKVRTGQHAVIRLAGFSEQEYGRMEGKVVSISPVPNEEGNYVAEIGLIRMPDMVCDYIRATGMTEEEVEELMEAMRHSICIY